MSTESSLTLDHVYTAVSTAARSSSQRRCWFPKGSPAMASPRFNSRKE